MSQSTTFVVVVLVALVACHNVSPVVGNMRESFEQAYEQQLSDLSTDTMNLAQSVWQLVCPNDCTTTTPAQNHSRNADPGITFNPKFTNAQPYLDLISNIGQVARYQFVDAINDDVQNDDMFTNDMFAQLMSANFKQLQTVYENFFTGLTDSWQTDPFMTNASLSGGSGLGFGVEITCNSQVILSIGGGCGTGFNGRSGNMTAGGGGGAGIQAYGSLGSQLFDAGGGGGGGLQMLDQNIFIPNWGTATDQGQQINKQVWQQLAQDMATCYTNGNLILRAAGGGGGGLWAGSVQGGGTTDDDTFDDDGPVTPVTAMAYGGGWGYSFTLASPSGSGTAPGPVIGSELGHVATDCHTQCMSQTASGSFYTCFCPCIKQGFMNLKMPWATHIQCYGVGPGH